MVTNTFKITINLLIILIIAGSGATLSLDVNIDEITQYDTVQIQHKEEIENLQEINFTIENTGSLGCKFQAGLETNINGTEQLAWSKPAQLWPGDSQDMEIKQIHENQRGTADARLFLEYCYQTETLENLTYNIDQDSTAEQENQTTKTEDIETTTTATTENQSNITTEIENATLVPKETPSMWRASASTIENGQTTINYDTQIFDPEETLKYYILQNEEIVGETTVKLTPETGLLDTVQKHLLEIILILSILFNLLLLTQTNTEKLLTNIKP